MKVQMFGGFTLFLGDKPSLMEGNRSNKALAFLQCILWNRKAGVSREALIDALYSSEKIENTGNALKILNHRVKKLLRDAGIQDDCILYQKGVYRWNAQVPYELDIEEFEQALQDATRLEQSVETRIALYQKAEQLFKGDFLPRCAAVEWANVLNVKYQAKYLECVRALSELFSEIGDYPSLQTVLDRAIRRLPYEEDIHIMRINCLMGQKRFHQAIEAFNEASEFYFNELGIEPTDKMKLLYKQSTKAANYSAHELPDLMNILKEPEPRLGAYYCNFLTFVEFFRLIIRSSARSGISTFLMHISIPEKSGEHAKDNRREAVAALQTAIQKSLRQGDIFTKSYKSEFLLLLSGISKDNCPIVFDRIQKSFQEGHLTKGIRLQQKHAPVTNVEHTTDNELRFSLRVDSQLDT